MFVTSDVGGEAAKEYRKFTSFALTVPIEIHRDAAVKISAITCPRPMRLTQSESCTQQSQETNADSGNVCVFQRDAGLDYDVDDGEQGSPTFVNRRIPHWETFG